MASSTDHEPQGAHQTKKATASGWIGSALEHYDFFIYATAASLIFPQIFFPKGDPKTAIVASLATYGVGYVARLIGTVVTALLPALFTLVAPPGAMDIPTTIGSITLAITVIAALSCFSARETYRVHMNDLGDPKAVPVPKAEYDRLREQTLANARMVRA